MSVADRRTVLCGMGVCAVAMPFASFLVQTGLVTQARTKRSYMIRDRRFTTSIASADRARSDGTLILDVNEDVTSAYLELAEACRSMLIESVAGVTAHTAKDIISTLFPTPNYRLAYEHAVEEKRPSGTVKLWAWNVVRAAGTSVR